MDKKQKKEIFENAKKASSQLIFWNLPEKKRNLNEVDKKELEYRLWKNNTLDSLIFKKLGDDGWNNYKEKKLSDTDFKTLDEQTQELNILFTSLTKQE